MGDRYALDVLHNEILTAIVSDAGVQEPRDIRMVEPGQDLAFGVETPHHFLRRDARVQELDRDFFLEVSVGPGGEVNGSHSATPDLAGDHVGADPLADSRNSVAPNPSRRIFGARFEIVACASPENFRLGQERFSLLEQRLIVGTRTLYKRQASAGGFLLERVIQDRL